MAKDKRRAKSIRMTEDVRKRYDELVAEEGIDQSELIDRMIEAYCNRSKSVDTAISLASESENKNNGLMLQITRMLENYNASITDQIAGIKYDVKEITENANASGSLKDCSRDCTAMLQEMADQINSSIDKINAKVFSNKDCSDDNANSIMLKIDEFTETLLKLQPQCISDNQNEGIGIKAIEAYADACYRRMFPALRAIYNGIKTVQENAQNHTVSEDDAILNEISRLRNDIENAGKELGSISSERCHSVMGAIGKMETMLKEMADNDTHARGGRDKILELERMCKEKDKIIKIKDEYIGMLRD